MGIMKLHALPYIVFHLDFSSPLFSSWKMLSCPPFHSSYRFNASVLSSISLPQIDLFPTLRVLNLLHPPLSTPRIPNHGFSTMPGNICTYRADYKRVYGKSCDSIRVDEGTMGAPMGKPLSITSHMERLRAVYEARGNRLQEF